jgi:hypothetical protein
MVFLRIIIVVLNLSCLLVVGCTVEKRMEIPSGPIAICYTSVRGASPRVVDNFVIVSASESVPVQSGSPSGGVYYFVVPNSVEPIFKRKLIEIFERYDWATLSSIPPRSADEPFRRLLVKAGSETCYVEIHENSPSDEFLNDMRLKRFYAIVSEVRLLGETFGVRSRAQAIPAAESLTVPLERIRPVEMHEGS